MPAGNSGPQFLGWSDVELQSMEDMQELRYRIPGSPGEMYGEMGVSVITLPAGKIFPTGERGVIDAGEYVNPDDDEASGFPDVWQDHFALAYHETVTVMDDIFDKNVWDSIPEDLQMVVLPDVWKLAPRRWSSGCLLPPCGAATGKSSVWGVPTAEKERSMPENAGDTLIATVMEQLMAEGLQAMAQIVTVLMNLAMRMQREQFLAAGHYERVPERRGYANGTKPKQIDTAAGTLDLTVPKTAGTDEPYYSQALAQRRLCGAPLVPRGHAGRSRNVCVWRLDTAMPSGWWRNSVCRACHRRRSAGPPDCSSCGAVGTPPPHSDDDLEAWRSRTLGEIRYLFLNARSREITARRRGARRCRAVGSRKPGGLRSVP